MWVLYLIVIQLTETILMYSYIVICVYVCVCGCVCVCVCVCLFVYVYVCMYVCMYVYMYVCMHYECICMLITSQSVCRIPKDIKTTNLHMMNY